MGESTYGPASNDPIPQGPVEPPAGWTPVPVAGKEVLKPGQYGPEGGE